MQSGSGLSWVDSTLQVLVVVLLLGFVTWLVLALFGHFNRRAYNLTVAESTGRPRTPTFLDNHGRQAELRAKAVEFDQRSVEQGIQDVQMPGTASQLMMLCTRWVRWLTLVASLVSFVVASYGAVASIELYDSIGHQLTNMDRFTNIIKAHWLGAIVAIVVIVIELVRFCSSINRRRVTPD